MGGVRAVQAVADGHCRLCNVTDVSRYYDAESLPCEGDVWLPLDRRWRRRCRHCAAVGALQAAPQRAGASHSWPPAVDLCRSSRCAPRASSCSASTRWRRASRACTTCRCPTAVKQLLSVFELFNINIGGIGLPLQCLGLGTYEQQLMTTMLAPVALAAVMVLGFLAAQLLQAARASVGCGLLAALPWLLSLSFLVFPMVSSAAFRAFSCEAFDDGRSYLRADYAVECDRPTSARARAAKSLAWLGIALYPVGISLLYVALLLGARAAPSSTTSRRRSPRRSASSCATTSPPTFGGSCSRRGRSSSSWASPCSSCRAPIEQLVIAFLFSLVYMLLVASRSPSRTTATTTLPRRAASRSDGALLLLGHPQGGRAHRGGRRRAERAAARALRLRRRHRHNRHGRLDCRRAGAGGVMAAKQLADAARLPVIKLEATKATPELSLATGGAGTSSSRTSGAPARTSAPPSSGSSAC